MHEAMRFLTFDRDNKGRIKIIDKRTTKNKLGFSPDEFECFVMTYAPEKNWFGGI
jgi:hypothetical protein